MSPPPIASPGHPVPPDGDSHEEKLSAHEYRVRMEAWQKRIALEQAEALGKAKAEAFAARLWKIAAAAVVLILGTVGALAWGQSKIDGGVAPIREELAEHKKTEAAELSAVKADVKEAVRSSNRAETMTEMLLRNRGIRPPPKLLPDGGEP